MGVISCDVITEQLSSCEEKENVIKKNVDLSHLQFILSAATRLLHRQKISAHFALSLSSQAVKNNFMEEVVGAA